MFCDQCEQTVKGGCKVKGVCGKSGDTSGLQDLLQHQLKIIASLIYGHNISEQEKYVAFITAGLFTTVTNVNFDDERLVKIIKEAQLLIDELQGKTGKAPVFILAETEVEMLTQAESLGIMADPALDPDIRSLRELLTYGLRGLAAYAHHASEFGSIDQTISAYTVEALAALLDGTKTINDLLALNLKCGEVNIKCMELLSNSHTGRFGHPVPTEVSIGQRKGPAILVSGHDLLDLEELLKQTEGKGINVYTHGEMLPAHGYPGLNKYKHLAGNYGGAWQDQQKEFKAFPGSILMTTNCIQKPDDTYKDRIFTGGLVAWPGVKHITERNYSALIKKALELDGFSADIPGKKILVGFGHNAVLGVADKVISAIQAGKIKHFFLIGGCDGAKSGRNYYTEFAEQAPKDSVILTLACGKFRFNKLDFGNIDGIPRLLDIGQCNDAYSAIQIALALSKALDTPVNDLPLSFILSWYEQKAVVILLSLLYLGIQGIRLGPTLPEFVSPNVLDILVKNYKIKPVTTAENDLAEILGRS
ncbi:MAG: hydroxylamine reductase [Candidatus Margulisiibacteriota bacterium]|jgi:hydroxylamine reductase